MSELMSEFVYLIIVIGASLAGAILLNAYYKKDK